jgi:hypothetical protein
MTGNTQDERIDKRKNDIKGENTKAEIEVKPTTRVQTLQDIRLFTLLMFGSFAVL